MLSLSNVSKFCGFCKENHWKQVGQREYSAEDPAMKLEALKTENRKLRAAIARQLNELAGRVAGFSGGVEPRRL